MSEAASTYVSCLTPAGRGAIAVLAVHGQDAWSIALDLFQPRNSQIDLATDARPGRFWLGRMGETSHGFDDVVLVLRQLDPTPSVEIHCHGGIEVVRLLEKLIIERGAQGSGWQQLIHQSHADKLQAQTQIALAEALTARTASILLDQYHGSLRRSLEQVCALTEEGKIEEAGAILTQLCAMQGVGGHLTKPWRVVIAGAPNAGKSSLVNALAGFERSVVSAVPGTTRDVVTLTIAIDGWPVELTDTAGWRDTIDGIEQEGVRRARDASAEADLCLWLLDSSAEPVFPDRPESFRYVLSKTDLPPAWDLGQFSDAIHVSARTGQGLTELCQSISRTLVPDPPSPGMAVPFTSEQCQQISLAAEALTAGDSQQMSRALSEFLRQC